MSKYYNPRLWTLQEIKILKSFYGHISIEEIQTKLHDVKSDFPRSFSSIRTKANLLKLTKKLNSLNWSNIEIDFLKNNFYKFSYSELSIKMGRTVKSIQHKALDLDLRYYYLFNDEEIEFLKNNYESDIKSLSTYLNRSVNSIVYQLKKMNLFNARTYKRYTDEEIEFLKNNSHLSISILSKKLNRSCASIRDKLKLLNIYNPKPKITHFEFSELELLKIKLYYPTHTVKEISKIINRKENETRTFIKRMGIKKRKKN